MASAGNKQEFGVSECGPSKGMNGVSVMCNRLNGAGQRTTDKGAEYISIKCWHCIGCCTNENIRFCTVYSDRITASCIGVVCVAANCILIAVASRS